MDHFSYKNGIYHAEDVSIPEMADAVGTPFYCYSTATLNRHYEVFAGSLKPLDALVCFAVKANSNLGVLATLAQAGSGADVVSEGEIRRALAAGVDPKKIVFSGVAKTKGEMAFALEAGILQFNAESWPEIAALNEVSLSKGVRAPLAIRVNPDVEAGTHAKISTGSKENKFGIGMEEAREAYRLAAALPGIRVQGISVHIGSQLTSLAPFASAFSRVREFAQSLRAEGQPIEILDLGGGLGIPYSGEEPPPPSEYAQMVARELGGLSCRFIFEPGRLIAGNAGILVSRVIYVKRTPHRTFVMIDAGMNDLMRPALYGAHHDILPVRLPDAETAAEAVDVVGPVCESSDIFAEQRLMKLPREGDLLALRSAGAYGASMANTYNSRLLVPEVMVSGARHCHTRPRQTYTQMLAAEKRPDWM